MPSEDIKKRRAACRKHYRTHKKTYWKKNKEHKKELLDYIKQAKDVPCSDCKKRFPHYVMDFDHVSDKEFIISEATRHGVSLTRLKKEISKCDVVCANCHRVRTFKEKRSGSNPSRTTRVDGKR